MARNAAAVAKVICFRCRESTCACVAELNLERAPTVSARATVTRALAWLGCACVAGSALGAGLALLLG
jgi:hypothetical protein